MDRKWEEWLQRELDGELSEQERREGERELQKNPELQKERESFHQLDLALRQMPSAKPARSLVDQIDWDEEEKKSSSKRSKKAWILGSGVFAALLLIGMSILWKLAPSEESMEEAVLTESKLADPGTESSSPSSLQAVSPDGQLTAVWKGSQLQVYNLEQKVVYSSPAYEQVEDVIDVNWKDRRTVEILYYRQKREEGSNNGRSILETLIIEISSVR